MTSLSDSSPKPLIDTPVEALMEWDSPFRHSFVPGSLWAPWLMTAKFPPSGGPAPVRASPPLRTVKPPEPPTPSASDEEYAQYRRDYEARLDEAYAEWKRSIFVSLFEPWIIDRRADEAAKKLGRGVSADS
jgi:hypothetical protein